MVHRAEAALVYGIETRVLMALFCWLVLVHTAENDPERLWRTGRDLGDEISPSPLPA